MGQHAQIFAKRFSQEELEKLLDSVLKEQSGGKTVSAWTVGDSSAQRQIWLNSPPGSRAALLIEALVIVNPTEYPPDQFLPVTQTRPIFC